MLDIAYVDASAIVKMVVEEPESDALRHFLEGFGTCASAELARAEVLRAVRRAEPDGVPRVYEVLARLVLIAVTESLLDDAGALDPPDLRTLDAIHLAAARTVAPRLGALVTYDTRMQTAASVLAFPVEAPR